MKMTEEREDMYQKYEELLIEREQVRKETEQIWIQYMETFGQLLKEVYEIKLDCIRLRKKLAYCQRALNRGERVDPEALQAYLDRETAFYRANLKRMTAQYEAAKNAQRSSPYEVQRARELYRRLAKMLHPDLNPATDNQETLQTLWFRIQDAYGQNDVRALSELDVLTRRALRELGLEGERAQIPDLGERIAETEQDIRALRSREPYTYRALLEDAEATEEKNASLKQERDSYLRYREELDSLLRELPENGGEKIVWLTN